MCNSLRIDNPWCDGKHKACIGRCHGKQSLATGDLCWSRWLVSTCARAGAGLPCMERTRMVRSPACAAWAQGARTLVLEAPDLDTHPVQLASLALAWEFLHVSTCLGVGS